MARFTSKGIEAAVELSGHKSERYIWRYIQASEDEMEKALTDLWDCCQVHDAAGERSAGHQVICAKGLVSDGKLVKSF